MSDTPNLRRSSRIKTKYAYINQNSQKKYETDSDNDSSDDAKDNKLTLKGEIEEELEQIQQEIQRPIELFDEEDISGEKIYQFVTPAKKNGMVEKANLCATPVTPKTLSTPKLLPRLKVVVERINLKDIDTKKPVENTPNDGTKRSTRLSQRQNSSTRFLKKRNARGSSSSESESISEDSEYKVSDDETDDDSDENASIDNDISDSEIDSKSKGTKTPISKQRAALQPTVLNTPKRQGGKYRTVFACKDYHLQSDEYFKIQAEKVVTSDHTLGKLKNTRLTEDKLQELELDQNYISNVHRKCIAGLSENCRSFFPMWHFILEEGYSLLLYGLGSKRNLINAFHEQVAINYPTLVVNGFFPSLTIKEILDGIIVDLLGLESQTNPSDCLDLIKKALKDKPSYSLYLLVHNLDGPMLRSNKAQDVLACLASIPNLYLLASVDHINTPLMWDHAKRSKYNFYWWDASTFIPYKEETSFESSLLVQQNGALALSSLQNVFRSLTSNARSIYIILVKYQLENGKNSNFTGMAFKDLYRAAREEFLVSSDLALRAQLTEFIDHKLVKPKRSIDGAEYLIIPLNDGLLKQFLEQHNK